MLFHFRRSGCRFYSSSYGAAETPSASAVALVADKSIARSEETMWNTKNVTLRRLEASSPAIYSNKTLCQRVFFCLGKNHNDLLAVIHEWMREQRSMTKSELKHIVRELIHGKRYDQALQIHDWMADQQMFELQPGDYAVHLDLIAKLHGLINAEDFFEGMPENMKAEECTCTTLLRIYIQNKETAKTEALMKKMAESGLLNNPKPYSAMISTYISTRQPDKALEMIEQFKKNARPNTDIYNQWLSVCAYLGDVETAEIALAEMKQHKVERNWITYSTLSGLYIKKNLIEKAGYTLRGLEFKASRVHRMAYRYLLSMHASIGNRAEVLRIWGQMKLDFRTVLILEYAVMIRSLLRLEMFEKAEEIYHDWASSSEFESRNCKLPNILLQDYINRRGMEAADGFFDTMVSRGFKPTFTTWELLTWGYLNDGSTKAAVHCFGNALRLLKVWKPNKNLLNELFSSLEEAGDVEGAEEVMKTLQRVGHVDTETYNWLLKTYAKAGKTEHKIVERMRRDRVDMDEETRKLIDVKLLSSSV